MRELQTGSFLIERLSASVGFISIQLAALFILIRYLFLPIRFFFGANFKEDVSVISSVHIPDLSVYSHTIL